MTTRTWAVFVVCAVSACGPTGQPGDGECESGEQQCDGSSFERCEDGNWVPQEQCTGVCDADQGCLLCSPNSTYCDGDTVSQCNADGNGRTPVETCSGGLHCSEGECADLCAEAAEDKSYLGCEYFSVDLDNAVQVSDTGFFGDCPPDHAARRDLMVCWDSGNEISAGLCDPNNGCPGGFTCMQPTDDVCVIDATHSPFAVVVSNPQAFDVRVTIANATGTSQDLTVRAGQVAALFPQMMGFPDQSVDRTSQAALAYRITSDAPIVAYQFNPLNNVGVFSNAGSLLIPKATWDVVYYAMTWASVPIRPQRQDWATYLTIVAGMEGASVEVTPRAAVAGNGAIANLPAGDSRTFELAAFEVLNLEALGGGDLTGSVVRATDGRTFGMFAGHEAIRAPQSPPPDPLMQDGPCCNDHIEEMMFPASTWGKTFALARSKQRNGEPDRLRILAQKPGTQITFMPAPITGSCGTLGPGQFCEVKIMADTAISSTEPVLIGHYLESVIWGDGGGNFAGNGDPSMSLLVPIEQFRLSYTVLIPSQYEESHIAVSTPMGGSVFLDGADVSGQLQPFAGAHKGGRIRVSPGQHKLECPSGCGIEVMGYSDSVGYLFAGGLDLRPIVVE